MSPVVPHTQLDYLFHLYQCQNLEHILQLYHHHLKITLLINPYTCLITFFNSMMWMFSPSDHHDTTIARLVCLPVSFSTEHYPYKDIIKIFHRLICICWSIHPSIVGIDWICWNKTLTCWSRMGFVVGEVHVASVNRGGQLLHNIGHPLILFIGVLYPRRTWLTRIEPIT